MGYDRSEYNALIMTVQAVVRTVMQIVLVLVGLVQAGLWLVMSVDLLLPQL